MNDGRRAGARIAALALAGSLAVPASVQAARSGYLCCNLRVYKDWISDINYEHAYTRVVPVGSPIRVIGSGRYSLVVRVAGRQRSLGNDYSRSLSEQAFARRYIDAEDPRQLIATYDPFTQDAIRRMKVMPGMTETQVRMAIGYPVANYTPRLSARAWQFWLDRSSRFDVVWTAERRVARLAGDGSVLGRVLWYPPRGVVKDAQAALNQRGFDVGEPDGLAGRRTRAAIAAFQQAEKLPESRMFDADTLGRLGVAMPARQ